jgi:hypothetical protein
VGYVCADKTVDNSIQIRAIVDRAGLLEQSSR